MHMYMYKCTCRCPHLGLQRSTLVSLVFVLCLCKPELYSREKLILAVFLYLFSISTIQNIQIKFFLFQYKYWNMSVMLPTVRLSNVF